MTMRARFGIYQKSDDYYLLDATNTMISVDGLNIFSL